MAAARAFESAPLSRAAAFRIPRRLGRRGTKPRVVVRRWSLLRLDVRRPTLHWACQWQLQRTRVSARANAPLWRRTCHAARPATETTVTRLERCARRTRGGAARRFGLFAALSALIRPYQACRRALRRFFPRRCCNWSCAGASPALNIGFTSLGCMKRSVGSAQCPSIVTVSRGGVARLVQPTAARQNTRQRGDRAQRTTLIDRGKSHNDDGSLLRGLQWQTL